MESKNNKKNVMFVIGIVLVVILAGLIGVAFAYLIADVQNIGIGSNIDVQSKTIDNMVFNKGSTINLSVDQDSLALGNGNLSSSTTSTVDFTARNNSDSSGYYKAFILIPENPFIYTDGSTPEILLTVTKNNVAIISNQDITIADGAIELPISAGNTIKRHTISATSGSTTTDSWTATVTFVNLNTDQYENSNKDLNVILYFDSYPLIPNEYQEIAYIASTGSQYIDTGFTPDQQSSAVIDFEITSTNGGPQAVFGTRNVAAGVSAMTFFKSSIGNWAYSFGFLSNVTLGSYDTNRHIIEMMRDRFYMDGELKLMWDNYQAFTAVHSAYLMAYSNSAEGVVGAYFTGNVYSCKIYSNGDLVRQFIPVKRKSDSVVGMLDIINDTFYTNSGTGNFIAGPDIT